MSEVEDGNYKTGNRMNQFENILKRNICFKYISMSFTKHPELISSVSAPHIYKLQVGPTVLFSNKKTNFQMLFIT